MDFSLPTIFVKPFGVANATSGASSALTAGQIGIYDKTLLAVADGNTTAFRIAQGRHANEYPQTTKKSDLIKRSNIVRYIKTPAVTTAVTKQIKVEGFTAKCGEEVTLTLRLFSKYINVYYNYGWTKSFVVQTPCCECGDDPCETVDYEELIDSFVTKINASDMADWVTAAKVTVEGEDEAPDTYYMTITAKAITQDPTSASMDNFIYDGYDALDFYVYAGKAPETTSDPMVEDRCNTFATVTTVRTATHTKGSSREISRLERENYSYQTGKFKDVNCDPDMNPVYVTNVVPGKFYDQFLITYKPARTTQTWEDAVDIDETVLIYVETTESATFTTTLNAIVGSASIETDF